jgi:hypothetical protein
MSEEKSASEYGFSSERASHQEVAPPQRVESRNPGPKMVIDTIKFEQDGDGCDSNNMQFLTIRQEDAGEGSYWIIDTTRWAFDSVDDLISLLRKAEKARGGRAWRG